ncbi:MAG: hypothetical protein JW843_11485 [Candidatus Aminicenantes bacterium]|nr:hypothetical protein [Candidatus Aminicenantes bacterium]
MPLVVIGVLIILIWLVLNHIRKQQIMKDVIALQKTAMEKGLELPNKDLLQVDTGSKTFSLRVGIISLCLGLALVLIAQFVPDVTRGDQEGVMILRIVGTLTLALSLGNFLSWFFIDRKR